MRTINEAAAISHGIDLKSANMQPVRCSACKKMLLEVSAIFIGVIDKKCPQCGNHIIVYGFPQKKKEVN